MQTCDIECARAACSYILACTCSVNFLNTLADTTSTTIDSNNLPSIEYGRYLIPLNEAVASSSPDQVMGFNIDT